MATLIFYDSSSATSLACAYSGILTRDSYVLNDLAGLDAAGILSAVQAEVANKDDYTEALICIEINTFGVDTLAEMDSILAGTEVIGGDAQANTTATNVIFESTASATNDFYNAKFVKLVSGETTLYRYISDYVGSSKTATIATTTTAITTGDTYSVYTLDKVKYCAAGAFTTAAFWSVLYPNVNVPLILDRLRGAAAYRASVTDAGTYTTTTITSSHTANKYAPTTDDHFVVGIHATSGTGTVPKIAKISGNTATVISLAESIGSFTGNLSFYIDRPTYMFHDLYLSYAIPAFLASTTTIGQWRLLLDACNDLADSDCRKTYFDESTYADLIEKGRIIFLAKCAGVVS